MVLFNSEACMLTSSAEPIAPPDKAYTFQALQKIQLSHGADCCSR